MRKNNLEIRKEHEAVRNSVGYYDFTHQLLEVTGKDAKAFLDYVFVANIGNSKVGDAKYTTMLNEEGIIIDDVIVFMIAEERFWISTLYINELIAWFDSHNKDFEVVYEDITNKVTMYAVQGPKSREVLNKFLSEPVDSMKYFSITDNKIDDIPVRIARMGYTGELGYEIYCTPDDKPLVESKLDEAGKEFGILNLDTDVIITSLPREKGYVLMSDLAGTNPLEVDFGWTVNWKKDFIGKEALEKVKAEGAKRSLLGFTIEDDEIEIAPGSIAKLSDEIVGKVTVFTYGYTVEKSIGFVLVDNDKAKIGDIVNIVVETKEIPATLVDRVFYDPSHERIKG